MLISNSTLLNIVWKIVILQKYLLLQNIYLIPFIQLFILSSARNVNHLLVASNFEFCFIRIISRKNALAIYYRWMTINWIEFSIPVLWHYKIVCQYMEHDRIIYHFKNSSNFKVIERKTIAMCNELMSIHFSIGFRVVVVVVVLFRNIIYHSWIS